MGPWSPPDWRPSNATSTSACGTCAAPLTPKSKSPDFCDASCQDLWHKSQADPIKWTLPVPAEDSALSDRIRSRWGLQDPGKDVA